MTLSDCSNFLVLFRFFAGLFTFIKSVSLFWIFVHKKVEILAFFQNFQLFLWFIWINIEKTLIKTWQHRIICTERNTERILVGFEKKLVKLYYCEAFHHEFDTNYTLQTYGIGRLLLPCLCIWRLISCRLFIYADSYNQRLLLYQPS